MPQTVGQYMGVTKGPVINQYAVTDAYRENYPFAEQGDRYCAVCGMLPYFCECARECVVNGETRHYAIGHAKATPCPSG